MTASSNKENPHIFSMGTANPGKFLPTETFLNEICLPFIVPPNDQESRDRTIKLAAQIGIKGRYFARDYFQRDSSILLRKHEPIETVMKQFEKDCPEVATIACKKALQEWGGNLSEITHFISCTSTGQIIPDVNARLIPILGLNSTVERVSVNFNGCCAGYTVMRIASDIAKSNKKNRILVSCTELCSLQMPGGPEGTEKNRFDEILASMLFGDGSAAFVIGCEPTENETPLFEVLGHSTTVIPDSQHKMKYWVTHRNWSLYLDESLPKTLEENVKPFTDNMMATRLKGTEGCPSEYKEYDFLIHTGGANILKSVMDGLQITQEQCRASWKIYYELGNMSSASVLFVMDQARKQKAKREFSIGLAFGPGLAVEGVVLRNLF